MLFFNFWKWIEWNNILCIKCIKNKKASERLLKNIEKSIKERSKNPESYARYERSNKSKFVWYRIYVKNFTIFYTVEDNIMKVAHIIYSRRDIERYI